MPACGVPLASVHKGSKEVTGLILILDDNPSRE